MATEVIMPALEMSQEQGVLVRWFKSEGEFVARGEPLMEIETDKAVMEIEAAGSGVLSNVTAREGDEIPVGQGIAWLLSEGEAAPRRRPVRPESSDRPLAPQPPAAHAAQRPEPHSLPAGKGPGVPPSQEDGPQVGYRSGHRHRIRPQGRHPSPGS